jgi:hypothetical protein
VIAGVFLCGMFFGALVGWVACAILCYDRQD